METTTRNVLYTEPSCANCIYGQLECTPAYWENPEEWDIECNYPVAGNISPNQDSINESFHHDYIDDAIECEEYKLASKKIMNHSPEQELLVDRILDDLKRKLEETDDELLLTNNRVNATWQLRTFSELQEGEVSEWLADYCDPNLSLAEKTRYLRSEINQVITKLLTEGAKI